jgi:protein ImuB
LAERFGSVIQVRLDQAFGMAREVIVPYRPAPEFAADCQLEVPTDRREVIDWLIAGLTERIAADLREHGVGAVRLAGRLDCGAPVTIAVGLFRPSASPKQFQDLLRLQLERLSLPGPVTGIRLCAEQTATLKRRQGELFADPAAQTDGDLAALLERLSSRLGAAAVVRPELCADPLPERAVRYVPVIGRRRSHASAKPPAAASHRPLRLFTPPPAVEAVALTPDGPPVSFRWEGRQHVIARHVGPERIETGWWRRGIVRRDYYRTETDAGGRFWLFRDLSAGRWHLHGSFE